MNTSSTLSSSYLHPGRIDHRYYRRRGYSSHQYVRQRGETTATCTTCDHSYKSTIRKQATAFQFPLTRHQTTKPATSARSNVLERISHALHGIMVYVSVASLAKGLHNCQRALAPSISPCCGQMELLLENNKLKFPSSSSNEHKTVQGTASAYVLTGSKLNPIFASGFIRYTGSSSCNRLWPS